MRRILVAGAAAAVLALGTAGTASAANPPGTGRPSQECGEAGATSEPAGFSTGGFANAEAHYNPGSQYDVACFQVTSSGH